MIEKETINKDSISHDFRAPFIAYFSSRDSMITVHANKVGSRFFEDYLGEQKKFNRININDTSSNEIIESFKTKIFFYRNPLDRFFGWYKTFVYTPYKVVHYEDFLYHKLLQAAVLECSFHKTCVENVYDFIMNKDTNYLIELFQWDVHTVPLYSFFNYTELSPLKFNIVDINDIAPFTLTHFGEWKRQYSNLPININDSSIKMLSELNEVFHELYKDDYNVLQPLVQPYYRTERFKGHGILI